MGSKQWKENERARWKEKRVRDSVWLERVVALLVNLTVGLIPRSSIMDNPLETKQGMNKMAIMV